MKNILMIMAVLMIILSSCKKDKETTNTTPEPSKIKLMGKSYNIVKTQEENYPIRTVPFVIEKIYRNDSLTSSNCFNSSCRFLLTFVQQYSAIENGVQVLREGYKTPIQNNGYTMYNYTTYEFLTNDTVLLRNYGINGEKFKEWIVLKR